MKINQKDPGEAMQMGSCLHRFSMAGKTVKQNRTSDNRTTAKRPLLSVS